MYFDVIKVDFLRMVYGFGIVGVGWGISDNGFYVGCKVFKNVENVFCKCLLYGFVEVNDLRSLVIVDKYI